MMKLKMCCISLILLVTSLISAQSTKAELTDSNDRSCQLKVMSFNIRYGTANDGENKWTNRRNLVFDVIKKYNPDVIGLQEALLFQIREIQSNVPGYTSIGVAREDGREEGEFSNILILTDKFEIEESDTFWLSDTPRKPGSITWSNTCTRICTWAKLTKKQDGKSFYIFNTHFDHRSQYSREKSAVLIADMIANITRGKDLFVLTGDYNAGETNNAILYLKGQLKLEEKYSPVKMYDSYRKMHPDVKDVGTFNGFKGTKTGDKIDYIFCPEKMNIVSAEIIYDNDNGKWPSDHFPIMTTFSLD